MTARKVPRKRLVAPRVRSTQAAQRLLTQMRALGSDKVLPPEVWQAATRLPDKIAANGNRP